MEMGFRASKGGLQDITTGPLSDHIVLPSGCSARGSSQIWGFLPPPPETKMLVTHAPVDFYFLAIARTHVFPSEKRTLAKL